MFRPQLYDIPVVPKRRVTFRFVIPGLFQFGRSQQTTKIMCVAGLGLLPVGKLMPLRRSCDAGFEGAFDGITGQIVSSTVHAKGEQRPGFSEPNPGQCLQILPVHKLMVPKIEKILTSSRGAPATRMRTGGLARLVS